MWTKYQTKHARVCGEMILFDKHRVLTWSLCVISWGLGITLVLAEYYLQPDFRFWHTFAYYHIMATLNCFCSLWYINCTAFSYVSDNILRCLTKVLHSKTSPSSSRISDFRHLWIDLSQMMGHLGQVIIFPKTIFFPKNISFYSTCQFRHLQPVSQYDIFRHYYRQLRIYK